MTIDPYIRNKELLCRGMYRKSFCLIFVLCFLSMFACTTNRPTLYRKSRALLDTYVTITVVSSSREAAEGAIDQAFRDIEAFGDLVNFYSENSEISSINRSAGVRAVKVSEMTFDAIQKALSVARESGGAFDPTIGPIMKLWDFHEKLAPSEQDIIRTLPLVQYRNVILDGEESAVFLKKKGMLLDLGGIAKGYAADLAVETLQQLNIGAGLVAIAGDIRGYGKKPDGNPWNVGIQNPRQKNASDEIIAKMQLTDMAVSTSGDYQRYFLLNGKRFHHLIDPKTGYPADSCRSVSVFADRGVFTDAYSTAVFILGPEKGRELISQKGLEAVIIERDGKIHTTLGLKGILEFEAGH